MTQEDVFRGADGKHLKEIVDRIRDMEFGTILITKYHGRIISADFTDERRYLSNIQLRKIRKKEANVKSSN